MPDHFTQRDLLEAWLGAARFGTKHSDLREFHQSRLHALQMAFGVDLCVAPEQVPPRPAWAQITVDWFTPERPDHADRRFPEATFHVWTAATEHALRSTTPFSDFMEAPLDVIVLSNRHAHPIATANEDARKAVRELMLDLLELLWGVNRRATVDAVLVRKFGFDPEAIEPDPDDYF